MDVTHPVVAVYAGGSDSQGKKSTKESELGSI